MAIHWAMCELAYPFYLDTAAIVGRALSLQDQVTLSDQFEDASRNGGAREARCRPPRSGF